MNTIKLISKKIQEDERLLQVAGREKNQIAIDVISNRIRHLRELKELAENNIKSSKIKNDEKVSVAPNHPTHIEHII